MDEYKNIFDILDAIEEAKQSLNEANEFKRELAIMGEPTNSGLKEIYRNTLKMIHYNMESNSINIKRLEALYEGWKNNE